MRSLSRKAAVRLAAAAALLTLAACQQTPASPPVPTWTEVLRSAAVADATLPLPTLTPITGPRATLVSWKRAGAVPAGGGTTSFALPTWVTVAGELKAFCRRYAEQPRRDPADLRRRVERLLGMRDGDGEGRVIVEFSVASSNVFRPCPDPSIDTTSCPVVYDFKQLNAQLDRDPVATRLLLQQILMSYVGQGGYPFTRGGYSYDWDPEAAGRNHVGLSEYVVKPASEVEILSISTIDDYCTSPMMATSKPQ